VQESFDGSKRHLIASFLPSEAGESFEELMCISNDPVEIEVIDDGRKHTDHLPQTLNNTHGHTG